MPHLFFINLNKKIILRITKDKSAIKTPEIIAKGITQAT